MKRLTLSKETLLGLENDEHLKLALGGNPTEIRSCRTCTTACSFCTL